MPTKYTMPWYFIWMPLGWEWAREAEEEAKRPCSLSVLLLAFRCMPCPMNINSSYARNMHEFTSIKWLERNGCSVICVLYLHRCSLFEIFQTKITDRDKKKSHMMAADRSITIAFRKDYTLHRPITYPTNKNPSTICRNFTIHSKLSSD